MEQQEKKANPIVRGRVLREKNSSVGDQVLIKDFRGGG